MLKKVMLKQKSKTGKVRSFLQNIAVCLLLLVFCGGFLITPLVRADRFDDQIRDLSNDSAQKKQAQAQMGAEAASLSDTIAKLQAQINELQAQINAYQAKIDDLQNQITVKEKELAEQRRILGENIKTMYLEGQISTLEMLASSKDLSEFVDRQEYRNVVRDKVKKSVDTITELKHQLRGQKEENENLLKDKQAVQAQVDGQQAENNRLLSLNQSEQAALDQQIKSNYSQISELRKQQAIENSRYQIGDLTGDPNNGGYPSVWANAPQDSIIDSWGMYNRECVSYTAWKVWSTGRYMPYWGGRGNANQWDDNARAAGIPVDGNPQVGDIAISNAGTWGHSMYVEAVSTINGQPAIYVSQYNSSFTGQFSRGWRYTTSLVFIHF